MPILYAAVLIVVLYLLARPVVNGAIYFPTPRAVAAEMVKMAGIKPGQRVLDIGSGDGRLVLAFAEAGAEAVGYEINPLLTWYSRMAIKKAGLASRASISRKSFWKANFSGFDAITVFGHPRTMKAIGEKFLREAKTGTKIISCVYKIPAMEPSALAKIGKYAIYLYEK